MDRGKNRGISQTIAPVAAEVAPRQWATIRRCCARISRCGLQHHCHQQPEAQAPLPPPSASATWQIANNRHREHRKLPLLSANLRHRSLQHQHHHQADGRIPVTTWKSKLDACPLPLMARRLQPHAIAPRFMPVPCSRLFRNHELTRGIMHSACRYVSPKISCVLHSCQCQEFGPWADLSRLAISSIKPRR